MKIKDMLDKIDSLNEKAIELNPRHEPAIMLKELLEQSKD